MPRSNQVKIEWRRSGGGKSLREWAAQQKGGLAADWLARKKTKLTRPPRVKPAPATGKK